MTGPVHTFSQLIRRLWAPTPAPGKPAASVVVHDPSAERAHDLDDPFFDDKVKARIGDTIAATARKP